MPKKAKIGEVLINKGLLTESKLNHALEVQTEKGGRLGAVLIDLNMVSVKDYLTAVSEQLDIPYIDIRHYDFDQEIVHQLPEIFARRYRALVLDDNGIELIVGMVDPRDIFAFSEIARVLERPVKQAVIEEAALLPAIDRLYRHTEKIEGFAEKLAEELNDDDNIVVADTDFDTQEGDATVIKLLNSIFQDAVQMNASDIHIEPDENVLRIRQRVDGFLQEHVMDNQSIISALTLRLKLMAGLDIAEKRLPQDGRFNIKVRNENIDVRLSTMPVQYGESVVMRLLNQQTASLKFEQLGMSPITAQRLSHLIHRPHGMILVTGPTGSGKTTSLYSALHELNKAEKKIITVEDPVEYRISRINQVQVNTKIDLSFGRVLRTALRQDPDIIMVGEIRDLETAQIALRAAMTGHLVLATLHTNDARSSVFRLMNMGAEAYIVATAMRAVLSQRLVRRICDSCREEYVLDARERNWLKTVSGEDGSKNVFYVGQGCGQCNHTGYAGRIGVYELLEFNQAMVNALRDNDSNTFYSVIGKQAHGKPLGLSALDLACQGVTSISEVIRIAEELDDVDINAYSKTTVD